MIHTGEHSMQSLTFSDLVSIKEVQFSVVVMLAVLHTSHSGLTILIFRLALHFGKLT